MESGLEEAKEQIIKWLPTLLGVLRELLATHRRARRQPREQAERAVGNRPQRHDTRRRLKGHRRCERQM